MLNLESYSYFSSTSPSYCRKYNNIKWRCCDVVAYCLVNKVLVSPKLLLAHYRTYFGDREGLIIACSQEKIYPLINFLSEFCDATSMNLLRLAYIRIAKANNVRLTANINNNQSSFCALRIVYAYDDYVDLLAGHFTVPQSDIVQWNIFCHKRVRPKIPKIISNWLTSSLWLMQRFIHSVL